MKTVHASLEPVIKSASLVVKTSTPPVIVVGLPRSGSSYLVHVLSCMDDWFIFDDLYPYQKAASMGLSHSYDLSKDPTRLQAFIHLLSWQLWAKLKYEENFHVPDLSLDDPFELEKSLLLALEGVSPITWPDILEEWSMRLALYGGKCRWGYKTPQDFMHLDELANVFPGAKFIYVFRDPRKMMRSFKNLPRVKVDGTQDGESRQYHPIVYSLYWKNAHDKVQDFIRKGKAPVEVVKFEDLVTSPNAVGERLAKFLDADIVGEVALERFNSSVKNASPTELTQTEIMLCEKIAGKSMQAEGYTLWQPTPRLTDLFDLLKTSGTFIYYQMERVVTDKRARTSVFAFLKSLFG